MNRHERSAFTVVELVIVLAVTAIMVGLMMVGWGNWKNSTGKTEVKSELNQVSAAMKSAKNVGSGYPAAIPSTVPANPRVSITLVLTNPESFCVQGQSSTISGLSFFISSQMSEPLQGSCTVPSVPSAPSIAYTSSFSSGGGGTNPRRHFEITAGGGGCSVGSTEWKVIASTSSTPDWGSADWKADNTFEYDYEITSTPYTIYMFAKPRCVNTSGIVTLGSHASASYVSS